MMNYILFTLFKIFNFWIIEKSAEQSLINSIDDVKNNDEMQIFF